MGTVTNVTCCGIDVGRLISDLRQYNDPKETVKKAEAVFRCLMDGKNLTTCYFQMDNNFKILQRCNECLHERGAMKCGGVLSCSCVFYTTANGIETMLDCPDLYTVVRPITHNDCLDSVAYAQQIINAKTLAQNSISIEDIWNSMNEDQKNLTYFMVGQAVEDSKKIWIYASQL